LFYSEKILRAVLKGIMMHFFYLIKLNIINDPTVRLDERSRPFLVKKRGQLLPASWVRSHQRSSPIN